MKFNLSRDLIAVGIVLMFAANAIAEVQGIPAPAYLEYPGLALFFAGVIVWTYRKWKKKKQVSTPESQPSDNPPTI